MIKILSLLDGQKIAKQLSISITKETKTIRKLLNDYNTTLGLTDGESRQVTLQEVLSPDSEFWSSQTLLLPVSESMSSHSSISWEKKKEMTQAYLLIKRSNEELCLLSEEKQNTIDYWTEMKDSIEHCLVACAKQPQTLYSEGSIALLKKLLFEVEYSRSNALSLISTFQTANDSSDDSEIDDDSDLEYLNDCD